MPSNCPCGCPCCSNSPNSPRAPVNGPGARVGPEAEASALRGALAAHQVSINQLNCELDEERSAAATAANEAMSMILRLQREKAEAQLELRQFKTYADEKMAHDLSEIQFLEDLIFKRDQAIEALCYEVQSYRHRLLSIGVDLESFASPEPQTPDTATSGRGFGSFDYPRLRCSMPGDENFVDLDKYPFGETPRGQLQQLENRINQLERMPSSGRFTDKGVVMGYSPRHLRRFSFESCGSSKGDVFPVSVDRGSDYWGGKEDVNDKVCTVDKVHEVGEDYESTPREGNDGKGGDKGAEIKKLYKRLQALEADRESMRQTIISMGTEKTQAALLKEIALQFTKEVPSEKKVVPKTNSTNWFSIFSIIKCVFSFVLWRKKPSRTKYPFGVSGNYVGLLLLLGNSPHFMRQKFITKAQVKNNSHMLKQQLQAYSN